ncbi:helix-turn-helix domain-containing protein [Ulvibacter antarcticus]|uniref:Helix-turn-helix protein n=1 Tax=Ulvibacter antarcticus TaxID=442714 RepID=A0A3L9YEZ4_9FLAO|nr:helix-turn-helix transcriptional regulator [Ulvibacter antarcticus]RMA56655.1 helix-turn-helix protein [Ulvibacter antarcticus]
MAKLEHSTEDFSFFSNNEKSIDLYIDRAFEISERINAILIYKGISQKELASMLGKSESQVSKWTSGVHNFTIKTITKLESVLEETIIIPVGGEEFNKKEQIIYLSDENSINTVYSQTKIIEGKFLFASEPACEYKRIKPSKKTTKGNKEISYKISKLIKVDE